MGVAWGVPGAVWRPVWDRCSTPTVAPLPQQVTSGGPAGTWSSCGLPPASAAAGLGQHRAVWCGGWGSCPWSPGPRNEERGSQGYRGTADPERGPARSDTNRPQPQTTVNPQPRMAVAAAGRGGAGSWRGSRVHGCRARLSEPSSCSQHSLLFVLNLFPKLHLRMV